MSGDLDFTLRARFLHTLTVHPLIDSVILTSNGGNVFAARSLAINIQEAELSIRVDQHCYSSCTLVFMASSQRSLGPEGQLGFHGYRYDMENRVQTLNIQEEEDKDRTYFSAKGVSSEFIDRIFDTPPTDIWRPDRKTLLAAGIITE